MPWPFSHSFLPFAPPPERPGRACSQASHRYSKLTSENRCCATEIFYGLYWDVSHSYLEVKKSNTKTSEFLTLSPCLNLCRVLSLFGRFSQRHSSEFFKFCRCFSIYRTTEEPKKNSLEWRWNGQKWRTLHKIKQGDKARRSDVFLLLFSLRNNDSHLWAWGTCGLAWRNQYSFSQNNLTHSLYWINRSINRIPNSYRQYIL